MNGLENLHGKLDAYYFLLFGIQIILIFLLVLLFASLKKMKDEVSILLASVPKCNASVGTRGILIENVKRFSTREDSDFWDLVRRTQTLTNGELELLWTDLGSYNHVPPEDQQSVEYLISIGFLGPDEKGTIRRTEKGRKAVNLVSDGLRRSCERE